jgi:cytochrome P450 family 3 subfamily A
MKYLDMVIDESLRMYPPGIRLDRVASCDYEYEGIKFKKGEIITIPIHALHHDPEIFPDPDEFKPERFSDENKKSRESVAFLGFGAGPRSCLGLRFAHVNIKLLLSSILSKYRLVTCDKTPVRVLLSVIFF